MTRMTISILIGLGAAVAGCSDGGGGVASIPAPPPSPASSPSPIPNWIPAPPRTTSDSPSGNYGVNAAVSDPVTPTQAFFALGVSQGRSTGAPVIKPLSSSEIAIGRDDTGGYTITVPVETVGASGQIAPTIRRLLFAENTRLGTPVLPALGYYAARQDASTTSDPLGDRRLTLTNPGGFSFITFAEIDVCNTSTSTGCGVSLWSSGRISLVYGQATPIAEIPLTGSANYHGSLKLPTIGYASIGYATIFGDLDLSLDFAARSASGTVTNLVQPGDNCCFSDIPLPDMGLSGSLGQEGALNGNVVTTANSPFAGGTWTSQFFGPNAAELGGTMALTSRDPAFLGGSVSGIFGAVKQ